MKDIAIEAAEAVKAAANALGYTDPALEQYTQFVTAHFKTVFDTIVYVRSLEQQRGPVGAVEAVQ